MTVIVKQSLIKYNRNTYIINPVFLTPELPKSPNSLASPLLPVSRALRPSNNGSSIKAEHNNTHQLTDRVILSALSSQKTEIFFLCDMTYISGMREHKASKPFLSTQLFSFVVHWSRDNHRRQRLSSDAANNGDESFSLSGHRELISHRCRVLLDTWNVYTNCAILSLTNEKCILKPQQLKT